MSIKFTSILKDLIVENARTKFLYDQYVKPSKDKKKPKIDFETFVRILDGDPTTSLKGTTIDDFDFRMNPDQLENAIDTGKYTQWLLRQFVKPELFTDDGEKIEVGSREYVEKLKRYQNLFIEDLFKVKEDLQKYERFKNRLPKEARNIDFLTPEKLYELVKDFSLLKTKITKDEKKEVSKTYAHPGAEIVYKGANWTVAKITDNTLGKSAAQFYGGNQLGAVQGETRWCTSAPGLNWYEGYISRGPLYVVIPNQPTAWKSDKLVGDVSGLPAKRFQFHFQDDMYMDPDDRSINLVEFLKSNEPGLKEYFRPEMMKSLLKKSAQGTKVSVNFPGDAPSKYIALYGFDDFFKGLPENIQRLEFVGKSGENLDLVLPDSIGDFKDLSALNFINCVKKVPNSICNLKKLKFLSLPSNPNLEMLPDCLADLPYLTVLNLKDINKDMSTIVPPRLMKKIEEDDNFHFFS
jgi:hypothetical protein